MCVSSWVSRKTAPASERGTRVAGSERVPPPHVDSAEPRALSLAVFALALPALATCSSDAPEPDAPEPDAPEEEIARSDQPIIRGVPSGREHDAVVVLAAFAGDARKSLCSATVVAPNLLLTARHCISEAEGSTACSMAGTPIRGGTVLADRDPHALVVFAGKGGVAHGTEHEANLSARGARLVIDDGRNLCNGDVGFVVLDRPLRAPIAPLRLGPPAKDERVVVVGWGIDETGHLPSTRETRSNVALIGIGPAMYPNSRKLGYGDREFMLGESACAGDSGSPAFSASGAIVGVAARAGNGKRRDPSNDASTCVGATAHAVYTHLGDHEDLVRRAFGAAGATMWREGEPPPYDR